MHIYSYHYDLGYYFIRF